MPKSTNRGGIFKGNSHDNGGIPIVVKGSGQKIEVEGEEALIPKEIENDTQVYTMQGTNAEVLDEILKDFNPKGIKNEVKEVHAGDMVTCVRSTNDPKEHKYTGTKKQIVSKVNESGGCNPIHEGGEQVFDNGGSIKTTYKSNLTPEQQKLVRTPSFKKWFGDWENDPQNASKVVDENGEPLVVYHGTDVVFKEFSNKFNERMSGFYFSNNIENAKTYGNGIISAFINIKTPLVINAKGRKFTDDLSVSVLAKYPQEEPYETVVDIDLDEIVYMTKMGKRGNSFIEIKNNKNYDGNIFKNLIDPSLSSLYSEKNKSQDTIVAFNSNQIKLADGSNTTFDGSNSDIRFDNGGEVKSDVDNFDWESLYNNELTPEQELEIKKNQDPKYSIEKINTEIDKKIKAEEDIVSDWGSRDYKSNKGIVYAGGDDIHGKALSIGGINEARRNKKIKSAQQVIASLVLAKEILTHYNEENLYESVLEDFKRSHYKGLRERDKKDWREKAKYEDAYDILINTIREVGSEKFVLGSVENTVPYFWELNKEQSENKNVKAESKMSNTSKVSVKKYKDSTHSDAYDFVRMKQTYSYEVTLEDGSKHYVNAVDKDEAIKMAKKEIETVDDKSIRTLGTGAKVYFESSHYRLNDNNFNDNGKYVLNLKTNKNIDGGSDAHYYFNDLAQAKEITNKVNELYPKGYPEALLIDKVIKGWINENKTEESEMQKKYDILFTNAGGVTVASNRLQSKNGDYKTVAHISSNGDIKYFEKLPPSVILEIEKMATPSSDQVADQEISPERMKILESVTKEKKTAYNYVYDRLLKVAPNIIELLNEAEYPSDVYGKSQYRTDDFGGTDGLMYLAIEGLDKDESGRYTISISHYYKQHGDMMCDPCMTARIDTELKTVEALSFKMDGIIGRGIIKEVYGLTKTGNEGVNLSEKKSQNSFLNTWSSNWVKQGHKVEFKPLPEKTEEVESTNDTLDLVQKMYSNPNSEVQIKLNEFPIVVEWSEGSEDGNIGFDNLEQLETFFYEIGFTDTPESTYIKNKVWFRNYPHGSVRIDISKSNGDFNPEQDNLLEWLTNDDKSFDWSIYTTISKEAQSIIKPEWDKMQEFLGNTPKYFKGISDTYGNTFELNKAIEEFLDSKSNDYIFSNEEKEFIYSYEGYGGLEKFGATQEETGKGLLYEYYTPKTLIEKMWGLAYKYGFNTGKVLEPSVGIGRFLDYTSKTDNVVGYEINKYSTRICNIIHPKAKIIQSSFAEHFYNGNTYNPKFEKDFDLVIGNPPYGKNVDRRATPEAKRIGTAITQYEHYFILRGLDCLKSGGLLIYVSTANLFTKGYEKVKERISEKADLVDGYLLPNSTFKQTKINTSLIVLRRK